MTVEEQLLRELPELAREQAVRNERLEAAARDRGRTRIAAGRPATW